MGETEIGQFLKWKVSVGLYIQYMRTYLMYLLQCEYCSPANPDPTAVIMGAGYSQASSSSSTLLEIHERLAREKAKGNGGGSVDELDSSFRLLLLINDLDIKLLHSSVKQMGQ